MVYFGVKEVVKKEYNFLWELGFIIMNLINLI